MTIPSSSRTAEPHHGLNGSTRRTREPRAVLKAAVTAAVLAATCAMSSGVASAQPARVLSPGDGVVTGFAGLIPTGSIDGDVRYGINLDGASARVIALARLSRGAPGALTTAPVLREILSREVGQVFAVALDGGNDADAAPNVYLGATTLFGVHLVESSGGERLEGGELGARFMSGQFGPDGTAGSIWKVDGATGAILEFARLPDNVAAGIGDIAYDPARQQLFASDLETGLIYRIDATGAIVDTFDHGVTALSAAGQEPVADSGTRADPQSPDFVVSDPTTWGLTQAERRVWGLTVHEGRVYYAIDGTRAIWSVGIGANGSFENDARRELDVTGLAGSGPITDLAFDDAGRLYVTQRGIPSPSLNAVALAEPNTSNVVRFARDAASPSGWSPAPDTYAIGLPADHAASNGGIALGYRTGSDGTARTSGATCRQTLWTTGDRLMPSGFSTGADDVHGLQGMALDAVRPAAAPPSRAMMIDTDGRVGDPERVGHIGDVEIFAPCNGVVRTTTTVPPGYLPPGRERPPLLPPEFPPPAVPFTTNLVLKKTAVPRTCTRLSIGWSCKFKITVTNDGPDQYFGDIQVRDTLPVAVPGASFGVGPVPPWSCWSDQPNSVACWRPNVLLNPGQSVLLNLAVILPADTDRCRLRNIAEIEWAPGGTQWNTDPSDDRDGATARVPLPSCAPVHRPIGSVVHRPAGSIVHRPIGSDVHRPRGSVVHRPRGSVVHRPRGSVVHRPRGSVVHRPRGSVVHRPRGSVVHRPRGSV
ncbi:MAG: hypothetical protein AAFR55_08505, partial [Pseudomonadota bacterium]